MTDEQRQVLTVIISGYCSGAMSATPKIVSHDVSTLGDVWQDVIAADVFEEFRK